MSRHVPAGDRVQEVVEIQPSRVITGDTITYARVADVAPPLGLTMPILVRKPGDHINVPDLVVEHTA
ncbi:hypothetical protein [Streptomyces viridochromogenes]|uniref:Uncharacterized protein n=1 Tax=Streptomyces viridochromogenes Tue57 TaxID=1160705 RepID=L8PKE1_STRVR|nr:hypothetical protein [Streptomyces viridochromogenes]ELS55842.1 hypothetical protein STVIR_3187 [Streptomyces viridochromogenes Tue57]